MTRFQLNGTEADLDEAVRVGRDAVAAVPVGEPERAGILSNLAAVLLTRFEHRRRPTDLDEAITAGRDARAAAPAGAARMGRDSVQSLQRATGQVRAQRDAGGPGRSDHRRP